MEKNAALTELLQKHWGYTAFRPGQQAIIEAVLRGQDTLGVLPTGGGKSICYQLPALLLEGIVLVVSPLISLMQDQVAALRARRIPAAFLHHELAHATVEQTLIDAEHGRYRLLYVSPERLQSEFFRTRLQRLNVSLLAVDEAHCISEWGHQFRPAYRQLAEVRETMGLPPTLALTATATPEVRRDIIEQLALRDPFVLVRGFDRPNIYWSVFYSENKRTRAVEILRGVEGSGIVYVGTRRHAEEWANFLAREGFRTEAYHGGLDTEEREARLMRWLRGKTDLIVATNAFGMGIDKPDVRIVLHVDIPLSLEAYYQEAGRAGRDGGKSYAVVLHGPGDRALPSSLIEASHPSVEEVRAVYEAVANLAQIPVGERPERLIPVDMARVRALTGLTARKIATAIELIERHGYWTLLPPRRGWARVRFLVEPATVRAYADRNAHRRLGAFVRALLRTLPGEAFTEGAEISLPAVARKMALPVERLMRGLSFLQEREMLTWIPFDQAPLLQFVEPRVQMLLLDHRRIRQVRTRARKRLQDMLRYLSTGICRRYFLLQYFGEAAPPRCGTCDICLGRHRLYAVTPEDEPLLRRLMTWIDQGVAPEHWFEGQPPYPHRVEGLLGWLLEQGWVQVAHPVEGRFMLTEEGRRRLSDVSGNLT